MVNFTVIISIFFGVLLVQSGHHACGQCTVDSKYSDCSVDDGNICLSVSFKAEVMSKLNNLENSVANFGIQNAKIHKDIEQQGEAQTSNMKSHNDQLDSKIRGLKEMMINITTNLRQELEEKLQKQFELYYTRQQEMITNLTTNVLSGIELKIQKQIEHHYKNTTNQRAEEKAELKMPGDCLDVLAAGNRVSGVYEIKVGSLEMSVYCDMTTSSGGWLVFQRRRNGVVNFTRTWSEYRVGFGDENQEFWLGNENLYQLTRQKSYRLRIDLEDHDGTKRYAEYQNFAVGSETYRLSFTGYTGNAGDAMAYHNGMYFTTIDRDNDQRNDNCALVCGGGGWWFNNCHQANLNGAYGDNTHSKGINWQQWKGYTHSLKATEMKIKPM